MDCLKGLIELENLKKKSEELSIPKFRKEKITDEINFQLRMLESDVITELGKELYQKLRSSK